MKVDLIQGDSSLEIKVINNDKLVTTKLIESRYPGIKDVHLMEIRGNDCLLILYEDVVYDLSLPELTFKWIFPIEGTGFAIYQYKSDFIIHGELNLYRLTKDGEIVWQRSGNDILTTPEGVDLEITETFLQVKDFEYNEYKWDFDGNLLSYTKKI